MIRSVHRVRIKRPLAEVFAFLQDPGSYVEWQVVMDHLEATDGLRQGSRITYTRSSEMGDRMRATIEITKNNGRDLLESVSVGGKFENHVQFRLEAAGPNETIFHATVNSKPLLALPNEAETALQYMIETRTEADLHRLQQVLESRRPQAE